MRTLQQSNRPLYILLITGLIPAFCLLLALLAGGGRVHADEVSPFTVDNGTITGFRTEYLDTLDASVRGNLALDIPAAVNGTAITRIADNAFAYSKYAEAYPDMQLTSLSIPDGVQIIGASAFQGWKGLAGVLMLPESVTAVKTKAFSRTSYSTICLPHTNVTYGKDALSSHGLSLLICPDSNTYNNLLPAYGNACTYSFTLNFVSDGAVIASKETLYNQPISFTKQKNGSWVKDSSYMLPSLPDVQDCKWLTPNKEEVNAASIVTFDTLTASYTVPIQPATITFGNNIDKDYNGQPASLQVTVSHNLMSSADSARDGNVIFYYTWKWSENGKTEVKEGYDLSSLKFTDAAELSVQVTVQAFVKGGNQDRELLNEASNTYNVTIRQAAPKVKPEFASGKLHPEDELPTLSLSKDSTPGTLAWKEGQTLREGTHSYGWIFTPNDTHNYTSAEGSIRLTAEKEEEKPLPDCVFTVQKPVNGAITLSGEMPPSGEITIKKDASLTFTITPDYGYMIEQLLLDEKDVTKELQGQTYTFRHSQTDSCTSHKLTASFRKMDTQALLSQFNDLPELQNKTSDKSTVNAYLDAKITYETLKQSRDVSISDDTLLRFYRSMQYLSSIIMEVDNNASVTLSEPAWLLESMTLEEAQKLRNGAIKAFKITVDVKEHTLTSTQKKGVLDLKKNASIAVSYSVSVHKTIITEAASNSYPLQEFSRPLKLQLSIPKELQKPADQYKRSFYVANIHNTNKRTPDFTLLTAQRSKDGNIMNTESYRFPVFTLLYVDEKQSSKPEKPAEDHKNENKDENKNENNGSSNTYVPDYEKEFWDSVTALIRKARAGDTVNVNAVTYDKMPEGVMAALREHPNVALIVRWDGGDPVIIPALTALTKDAGRVYYPLSYLSEHYKAINAALNKPVTGNGSASSGGASSGDSTSSGSTASGGSSSGGGNKWEVTAPSNNSGTYTPTSKDMGVDDSEEETETQTESDETMPETESLQESVPETETQGELEMKEVTEKGDNKLNIILLIVAVVFLIQLVLIFFTLLSMKKRR